MLRDTSGTGIHTVYVPTTWRANFEDSSFLYIKNKDNETACPENPPLCPKTTSLTLLLYTNQ